MAVTLTKPPTLLVVYITEAVSSGFGVPAATVLWRDAVLAVVTELPETRHVPCGASFVARSEHSGR